MSLTLGLAPAASWWSWSGLHVAAEHGSPRLTYAVPKTQAVHSPQGPGHPEAQPEPEPRPEAQLVEQARAQPSEEYPVEQAQAQPSEELPVEQARAQPADLPLEELPVEQLADAPSEEAEAQPAGFPLEELLPEQPATQPADWPQQEAGASCAEPLTPSSYGPYAALLLSSPPAARMLVRSPLGPQAAGVAPENWQDVLLRPDQDEIQPADFEYFQENEDNLASLIANVMPTPIGALPRPARCTSLPYPCSHDCRPDTQMICR